MSTTGTASLSSSAFITPAIYNLQNTGVELGKSTQRLSSGNRIVNVGDDVAAFSVATRLQTQLSGLKQAASNIAQGESLLQVAAGGLQQISQVLNSMKALAIQSNSSALTNVDRGYLQQQFSSLLSTIDTLVSSTTFNGISLLDGTLAGGNQLLTQTSSATKGSAQVTLSANPTAGQTIVLNGVTVTAGPGNDYTIGGDATASATNLASFLNSSTNTALSKASYSSNGAVLTITAKNGGTLSNEYVINKATSTATISVSGASTNVANVYTLTGGLDDGLGVNSTKATGSVSDTIVTTQNQTPASVTLTASGAFANNETLLIGDGNGGSITFTYKTTAALSTEIQIGSTVEETLQNTAKTISQYSNTNAAGDNYGLRQLEFSVNNSTLVIKNRNTGNVLDLNGSALAISKTIANGTLSGASFNNGTNGGVDASGVTNGSFVGAIQGFTATYVSPDVLNASITVGDSTYTGQVTDTTPAGNTTVRLSSTSGGYFDVQLAAALGQTVANQSDANTYATHLNTAFSGLTFYQDRNITNYTPTGTLVGSSARIQLNNSNAVQINTVSVTAPSSPGSDGVIDLGINGSTFRASSGIGSTIGAYETVRFTNTLDSSQVLTFTNGSTAQDFSTANAASTLQAAFATSFNIDVPGTGTDFQVGPNTTDKINVSLGSASSYTIFNGVTPDVGTQAHAASAQTAITTASNTIQTLITTVAGSQSSFASAADNVQQTITGVSAAHSALADTDIAVESTNFALNTLKLNAGIAIIAQALSLQSSLLNLVHAGKA